MELKIEELPSDNLIAVIDIVAKLYAHDGSGRTFPTTPNNFSRHIKAQMYEQAHMIKSGIGGVASVERLSFLKRQEKEYFDALGKETRYALRNKIVFCYGLLDGKPTVIPAGHWYGDINWKKQRLEFKKFIYQDIRLIRSELLNSEQKEILRSMAHGEELWHPAIKEREPDKGGRPTLMPIVKAEMERRAKACKLLPSLAREAKYLSDWLAKAYPEAGPLKSKTIQNRLGGFYKELVSLYPQASLN